MNIGAYQFAVTGDIQKNLAVMQKAIADASNKGVRLLAFSECALTGYPPLKTTAPKDIDFSMAEQSLNRLRELSKLNNMYLLVGTVTQRNNAYYNSVVCIAPDGKASNPYHKRALGGWDADNFTEGSNKGVYELDGYRIGVRICYEVRFPEYFRELFREKTDLNIVHFCDVTYMDNLERYELIKAHLMTRAVENTCPILSVNDIAPHQAAPTALINEDGKVLAETQRHTEQMLVYDLKKQPLSFSAQGRKTLSGRLVLRE